MSNVRRSKQMDHFSVTTAEEIFSNFPEWRSIAREEEAEDGSSFLLVEVPAPLEANVDHGLVIDTANGEVTIGFDCYHSHFDAWTGDGQHFGTQAALEFVKQILTERVAIISWWQGEQWQGSAQLEAGKAPESPSWRTDFNRIRVRSWKGSFNADTSA
jgi:hypothetical protein